MAKARVTTATDDFANAMADRMRQKQRQGFKGWDDKNFHAVNVPRRLHDKALKVLLDGEDCSEKDLIDIANFAMILHRRLKAK